MNETTPPRTASPSWRISWRTIILALLAIATCIAISRPGGPYVTPMGVGGSMMEYKDGGPVPMPMTGVGVSTGDSRAYYPYPNQNPDVPVTDTREFLKVQYNASMRTRDVQGLTRRVETTVRGYTGRIDQESSYSQYGYVSFAVPQSKYVAFRAELESLVGSRFLSVSISSQNLLSQKVSIEDQQLQADTALSDARAARQQVVSTHTRTAQALQSKIDADTQQLASLRAQAQTPQIEAQIQAVSNDQSSLRQQLASANTTYTTQLSAADAAITYAQNWQKAVQTQDQTLLDNVATVTGTVSIQWIGLWDMAQLYLPGYWIPIIFAFLTVLSFLWDRRRAGTLVH